MRPKRSSRRKLFWRYLVVGTLLLAIGWWAFTRLFDLKGSIILHDPDYQYEIWLDGNPVALEKVTDGWLIKANAGQHTLTLQNAARQETKILVKVRGGRSINVSAATQTELSADKASFVGSASYLRMSAGGKFLFYINKAGTVMRRYNVETGANIALSDAVFKSPKQISFSPDDSTVAVQSSNSRWYSFDFRKTDFSTSQFIPLIGNEAISLNYDPSRYRIGYIRAEKPGGPLGFYTAESNMSGEHFETSLKDLSSPRFTWAPHGRQIVMLDDPNYNESNLQLYDLASGERDVLPVKNVTRVEYDHTGSWLLVEEARGSDRWLVIIDTTTRQGREIGKLKQSLLASWRPNESVIWSVMDNTDATVITSINTDGSRSVVGRLRSLPGVWQRLIPTTNNQEILVQSSFDIWRVPFITE